jgi:hypothetical protein
MLAQSNFSMKHFTLQVVSCENYGVIRRVYASHRGAGYFFVDLGGLHLVYALFPFQVSTAQSVGEFWENR